jgi:RND family efflux transporter MFP subunit
MKEGRERPRRWLPVVGVAVLAALILGGVGLARREAGETPGPSGLTSREEVAVTVEPVTPRAIRRVVAAVGSLYGQEEITISSKVDGRVARVHYDIGDVVRPGELLLEIDPTDYQLAVAEGRRALDLELARVGLKELPRTEVNVAHLPSVARAEAQERNTAARFERVRRLGGVVAAEERDLVEKDHAVAQAEYKQALLDAQTALASARYRQAALETALQKLADTRVLAPRIAGAKGGVEFVVCQREVSQGEMVRGTFGMSTTLFKLVIDRTLKLKAMIPERYKGELKQGQTAELEVEAYPGRKFTGTVSRINPAVDRTSRTFSVEIQVNNDDRQLSPGSFAKVAVITGTDSAARTVPEEALVRFAGVTKVFVVQGDKAHEVPVSTGVTLPLRQGGQDRFQVEVQGDLPLGALVVTSGQSHLAEGTPVRIKPQTPAGSSGR